MLIDSDLDSEPEWEEEIAQPSVPTSRFSRSNSNASIDSMASRAKGIFSAKNTKDAEFLTELRLNRASEKLGYSMDSPKQYQQELKQSNRYKRFNPFERQ